MYILTTLLWIGLSIGSPADTLTLQYCYDRAYEHYPLAEKAHIQDRITRLNESIARTGYYPSIQLSGMASYQSDVTEVTFAPPGAEVPVFSKEHYRVALEVNQPLYNGGATGIRREMEQLRGEVEKKSVEVEMRQVREQIDRVYFHILLQQQQANTLNLFSEELRTRLKAVKSGVENGTILPGQQKILEAEIIKTTQDSLQVRASITAGYEVLAELLGEKISPEARLALPDTEIENQDHFHRPEYDLFNRQEELIDRRQQLAKTGGAPKLSAFATGAYGRPGLDAFRDELQAYYVVGLRLKWNFLEWSNSGKESEVLGLQRKKLRVDEEAFTRQLNSAALTLKKEIESLRSVIKKDGEIIKLREAVVQESRSRLDNGAITATEYVTELTHLNRAQLMKYLHEVQLVQKKMEYATKLGIPWN